MDTKELQLSPGHSASPGKKGSRNFGWRFETVKFPEPQYCTSSPCDAIMHCGDTVVFVRECVKPHIILAIYCCKNCYDEEEAELLQGHYHGRQFDDSLSSEIRNKLDFDPPES